MKRKFQALPSALQRQILLRFSIGALSLILFLLVVILYWDFYLSASFLLFSLVFGISGVLLLLRALGGKFVSIEGICRQVEKTPIRRKPKTVFVSAGPHTVRICLRHQLKSVSEGDGIVVYVADNMPVYQQDGCEVLNGYIAMEIRKGAGNRE